MTVYVIEDEGDERKFYENYTNHLREQSKLAFSIHGFTDEDKTQIEDALQELLTAEVIDLAHERLRARGVTDEHLNATRSDSRPTLRELPLPERDRRILEAKVRQLARQMMPSHEVVGTQISTGPPPPTQLLEHRPIEPILRVSHALGSGGPDYPCICIVGGGERPPGYYTVELNHPVPASPSPYTFWYFADNVEDAIQLVVEQNVYGPDEIQVGLATETDWAKQLTAWHPCNTKIASTYAEGPGAEIRYMKLYRGCPYPDPAIIFRKPALFGVWIDLAFWIPGDLWAHFGGTRITVTWWRD
jgi:hypothetical protein